MSRVIVYATERGTCKDIAEEIGRKTGIDVLAITAFKMTDIDSNQLVIFVVPTYARGQPPACAAEAWSVLKERPNPLTTLKFAVFGVGSSKFERTLLAFPRALFAKLTGLQATPIGELGVYNQAGVIDQDDAAAEWLKTLNLT
jgi:sulfite reductase alpha subunit-like flavoprotein